MKSKIEIEVQQREELANLLNWVGSKARLAAQLGVTRQAVYYWVKRGRISATCAKEVEVLTDGLFTKERLRPDVMEWQA